jgi:hypothetical protein
MVTFEEFNKLLGLPDIRRAEKEYATGRSALVPEGK